jgi:hypothetical protein
VRLGCAALSVILRPPLERASRLRLRTVPPGAALSVDGRAAGRTPVALELRAGRYRLALERPGFLRFARSVDLSAPDRELGIALVPTPETAALLARRKRKTTLGLVGLCVAAASLAAMGSLYGVGTAQGDDAYARYRAATLDAERTEHAAEVRAAERKLIAGHALAALAAAAVGFSLYHLFSRGALPPPAPP